MKRAALVSLALVALGACVPASEPLPAAGAAGFETAPSPETQGAPFTTADGWTIRIEKFFAQVSVSASPLSRGYGNSESYVFDARKPAQLFARALPVGTAQVNIQMYGRYLDNDDDDDDFGRVARINVDEETDRRFERLPDEGQDSQYTPGPSVILALRAEKDGRVLAIDMAINVNASSVPFAYGYGTPIEVREDQLATVPKPIRVESAFPTFDALADSDRDGDGRITAAEMRATQALTALEQRLGSVILNF